LLSTKDGLVSSVPPLSGLTGAGGMIEPSGSWQLAEPESVNVSSATLTNPSRSQSIQLKLEQAVVSPLKT